MIRTLLDERRECLAVYKSLHMRCHTRASSGPGPLKRKPHHLRRLPTNCPRDGIPLKRLWQPDVRVTVTWPSDRRHIE